MPHCSQLFIFFELLYFSHFSKQSLSVVPRKKKRQEGSLLFASVILYDLVVGRDHSCEESFFRQRCAITLSATSRRCAYSYIQQSVFLFVFLLFLLFFALANSYAKIRRGEKQHAGPRHR